MLRVEVNLETVYQRRRLLRNRSNGLMGGGGCCALACGCSEGGSRFFCEDFRARSALAHNMAAHR